MGSIEAGVLEAKSKKRESQKVLSLSYLERKNNMFMIREDMNRDTPESHRRNPGIDGRSIRRVSFNEKNAELVVPGAVVTINNPDEVEQLKLWVKEAKRMSVDVLSYVGWCINEHWS